MDFSSLARYPGASADAEGSLIPKALAVTVTNGADQEGRRGVWTEAPFLVVTTLAAALPPVCLVAFQDSLNDKPGGAHADVWSYPKVILVSAIAAALASLVRRAIGRPRTFEAQVFVPVLLVGAAVAAVSFSLCLWGRWVFEYR